MPTRLVVRQPLEQARAARPAGPGIRRLTPEVIGWLEECEVEGQLVRMKRKLAHTEYLRLKRALQALGGHWHTRLQAFRFDQDAGPILAAATGDGWYIDPVQRWGQFDTPDDLADQVVAAAGIPADALILEPSAGTGALIRAVLRHARRNGTSIAGITAFEIDPRRIGMLNALSAEMAQDPAAPRLTVSEGDVLAWIQLGRENGVSLGPYDTIVMNPPFSRGADIAHIMAVWPTLRRGGRLVAICAESAFIQQRHAAQAFRDWLAEHRAEVTCLPPASFRAAGTDVKCRMIVVTKGGAA